jgi:hypothetical protein
MKNLKGFHEFAIDETVNEYYSGEFSYLGREKDTLLGQKLADIRDRIKRDVDYSQGTTELSKSDHLDSPVWLLKNLFAGLAGAASGVAELFAPSKEDRAELKKASKEGDLSQDDVIELWSEKLGPKTTEKDLENFVKRSEKVALKRYGKSWNYDDPKGKDQKEFAEMIKKGEQEIAKRMKK